MRSASKRMGLIVTLATTVLGGCYIVPVTPDGRPVAVYPVPPTHQGGTQQPAGPVSAAMTARLYPTNDTAAQTGVLSGTVTNHLNGRGEFHLTVAGELLNGEATRVANDTRRGSANAYGSRGTYMNCQYQMNSSTQGSGVCTMSNGGRYQLHLGN
jgi:hypothetical protein